MSDRKSLDRVVELVASDLAYIPSAEQRRVKSAFWARWQDNPLCDPRDLTLSILQQLVPDPRIDRWWHQEGFKEWFSNQEEFRERAEFVANLALDAIQDILMNTDPKSSSARVNAAKLALEIARKMPSRQAPEKYADSKISDMDRKQLEEYIQKQLRLLKPVE